VSLRTGLRLVFPIFLGYKIGVTMRKFHIYLDAPTSIMQSGNQVFNRFFFRYSILSCLFLCFIGFIMNIKATI